MSGPPTGRSDGVAVCGAQNEAEVNNQGRKPQGGCPKSPDEVVIDSQGSKTLRGCLAD